MAKINWLASREDNLGRDFSIDRDGARAVTGALWLPAEHAAGAPLLLCGHGASGDRYQAPIPDLARRFTQEAQGAVLAIDGPVHGLRYVEPGGREALLAEIQRPGFLDDMVADWNLAIDLLGSDAGVGAGPIAYFGLSMGSLFGIPLLASRTDLTVATLGLLGASPAAAGQQQRLLADAARIEQPLLFLVQLGDEIFERQSCLEMFDGLASADKRLHANLGLHHEVPVDEIDFAFDFMTAHLAGRTERPIIQALAE